jgi:lipopolysaccharide biosynthesis regulator YciM
MVELFWLLLPIAAASGWIVARRGTRAVQGDCSRLSPEYFQGLNHLLNEQPDKAIEVFVRMLDVDSETVETHLALGNLFRRRGEVERAIRIHQNIFTESELSREQRTQGLLELGRDYMRAGLLDRAESLFLELCEVRAHGVTALRLLLDIYQQEKDWEKAIVTARRLEKESGRPCDALVAHYLCELAEQAQRRHDLERALVLADQSLATDGACVRASLMKGGLHEAQGDLEAALAAYREVERQDPAFLAEVVEPLARCYRGLGREAGMARHLADLLERHNVVSIVLAQAELLRRERGDGEAVDFLTERLRRCPSVRGMKRLIELNLPYCVGEARERLEIIADIAARLLAEKPIYRCHDCGFTGRALHWQCPSCKHWNTVKPIQGVEGE